jgi:hypothetical protein
MNNRGPKVEICGTPDCKEKCEEDFPEVRTTENQVTLEPISITIRKSKTTEFI